MAVVPERASSKRLSACICSRERDTGITQRALYILYVYMYDVCNECMNMCVYCMFDGAAENCSMDR